MHEHVYNNQKLDTLQMAINCRNDTYIVVHSYNENLDITKNEPTHASHYMESHSHKIVQKKPSTKEHILLGVLAAFYFLTCVVAKFLYFLIIY